MINDKNRYPVPLINWLELLRLSRFNMLSERKSEKAIYGRMLRLCT